MSEFSEVTNETPRLVVLFKKEGDKELFQWGVVGQLPLLTTIGYIVRVQSELQFKAIKECPESAFVIAFNEEKKQFSCFYNKEIPVDSLIGMLESIKFTLITTNAARSAANQQMILGPDGRPANNRRIH